MTNVKDRICVITTVHYCFDTRIYYREVLSLSKKYVVDYFAPCDEEVEVECSGNFVPLFSATSRLGRVKTQFKLIRLLLGRTYSAYHLHDPELILLGLMLKLLRKTVIFDMHENVIDDIGSKEYIGPRVRRLVLMVFSFLFELAQKVFDAFVLAEDSYQRIMKTQKYHIVHNYPLLREIEIPPRKKWENGLVYVGSIMRRRGIWNMLYVFQKVHQALPTSTLHLIGPFDEEGLRRRVEEWIHANALHEKVYIYGRIPNKEVFEILKNNSIGLCLLDKLAGFDDSLPTKIFEYMMAGVPVVVTEFPLWRDIVEDTKCGIAIEPSRQQEAADNIICLLTDEKRLKEIANNGLKAVQTKFNWANEESKLLQLYSYLTK